MGCDGLIFITSLEKMDLKSVDIAEEKRSMIKTHQDARDIGIACDGVPGWKLYELAAKIEDELNDPLDIIPLQPVTRTTVKIENEGKILM